MIDKEILIQYLGNNEVLFKKLAIMFVDNYKNFNEVYNELIDTNNCNELHRLIHSQKGISLNLGLKKLYDEALKVLPSLKENIIEKEMIDKYAIVLDKSLKALEKEIKA